MEFTEVLVNGKGSASCDSQKSRKQKPKNASNANGTGKSLFVKQGSQYVVTNEENLDIHQELPALNFVVKFNERKNEYFLDAVDSFTEPKKVYGDTLETVDRIVHTFNSRPGSTGVLLTGQKGSGKTLLSTLVSLNLQKVGVPTIIINSPFCDEEFKCFLQSITQPVVIVFDEFEKVYSKEEQELMLTLFDGTLNSKKLFIITCNNKFRVDINMINRPGRMYYALDFGGVSVDFIREYCADVLVDKSKIEEVVKIGSLFCDFAFDMLKALVEEMNRYNESAAESLRMLNLNPSDGSNADYELKVTTKDGIVLRTNDITDENPVTSRDGASYWCNSPAVYVPETVDLDPEHDSITNYYESFNISDLVDVTQDTFTYVNAEGTTAELKRKTKERLNYSKLF